MVHIKRIQSDSFTIIDNKLVRDERLSWKARGIFLYLYAQAEDWNFYEAEVATHATDGKNSLRTGLVELEKFGYLKRTRGRKEHGKFTNMVWELTMDPSNKSQKSKLNNLVIQGKVTKLPVGNYQQVVNLKSVPLQDKQITKSMTPTNEKRIYESIVNYLNLKTGRNYNPSAKATQELINDRLSEGYQIDDFIAVINTKVSQWLHDNDNNIYLRPTSLFNEHFDSYVNEKAVMKISKNDNTVMEEAWYE